MKHLNCKLYYQQLHLKYLFNLEIYWLQSPWGWHDSVETCRSVISCEIIVHLLVIIKIKLPCSFYRRFSERAQKNLALNGIWSSYLPTILVHLQGVKDFCSRPGHFFRKVVSHFSVIPLFNAFLFPRLDFEWQWIKTYLNLCNWSDWIAEDLIRGQRSACGTQYKWNSIFISLVLYKHNPT